MMEKRTCPTRPERSRRERSRRKRGGQLGNQNARTHGYYSGTLTREQQRALEDAGHLDGLDREIAVRYLKIASILTHDPHNRRVLKLALSSLAHLLYTRLPPDSQQITGLQTVLTLAKGIRSVFVPDNNSRSIPPSSR